MISYELTECYGQFDTGSSCQYLALYQVKPENSSLNSKLRSFTMKDHRIGANATGTEKRKFYCHEEYRRYRDLPRVIYGFNFVHMSCSIGK